MFDGVRNDKTQQMRLGLGEDSKIMRLGLGEGSKIINSPNFVRYFLSYDNTVYVLST